MRTIKNRIARLEAGRHAPLDSAAIARLHEQYGDDVVFVGGGGGCGVLVVPAPMDREEWELMARRQQAELLEKTVADARRAP
jgi:hypothetical protein